MNETAQRLCKNIEEARAGLARSMCEDAEFCERGTNDE